MLIATSKVSGRIDKRVTCEHCGTRYLYELSRSRRAVSLVPLFMLMAAVLGLPVAVIFLSPCVVLPLGGGGIFFIIRFRTLGGAGVLARLVGGAKEGGAEECDVAANKKLRDALLKGVELVACPQCGWYQEDMVSEYRSRQLSWLPWVGLWMLLVLAAAAYWQMTRGPNRPIGSVWVGPDYKLETFLFFLGTGATSILLALAARWLLALRHTPNEGFPTTRAPFPDAPPPVRESDHTASIVAATARITPPRRTPTRVEVRTVPPRALPPPPEK